MNRRRDIDWMRGIAVLCMIEHHTFDAFLRADLHGSTADRAFRYIGGLAAPGFLFLAGLAMMLALEKQAGKGVAIRAAALAGVRRGLLILAGAYLFRFQEWAFAFGAAPATDLLRIDVLNCIGIALVAVSLLWWLGARRIVAFLAVAAAVILLTPIVSAADLSFLPQHLADYLNGRQPRALFALFPWIAHAFTGAAAGLALARTRSEVKTIAVFAGLAFAAWLLPQPAVWSDAAPAVFLLRDGLAVGLLCACWLADRFLPRSSFSGPLLVLGRHSLLVYWVHVEIVYGRWFWRTRGTLGIGQGAIALAVVLVSMVALAKLIDALQARRRANASEGYGTRDRTGFARGGTAGALK
jgi:uncharacterized membrane protein